MARRRAPSPPHGEPSASRSRAPHSSSTSTSTSDPHATKTESQQMLAVGPLLRKGKQEDGQMEGFSAQVVGDRIALRDLVRERKARIQKADAHRHNTLLSALVPALQTPSSRVDGPVPTFPGTRIAENMGFAAAAVVLSASDDLVSEYERVDGGIMSLAREKEGRDAMAGTWRDEVRSLERVLKAGARKAERDVARVLGGVRVEEEEGADGYVEMDMDMDGVQVMQGEEVSDELKKSFRYMERGVRRMVKALPRDED